MANSVETTRLAMLWQLSWNDSQLRCVINRKEDGLELAVESSSATILTQRFDLQPRALARAQALRDALKRRGWQEVTARPEPDGVSDGSTPP